MTIQYPQRPIALTIAGSDSSGGAGIQADLKTFSAFGAYGASVITALTAQNTKGVQSTHVPPAQFVGLQLESVQSDLDVKAIKTGMLANAEIIFCIADALAKAARVPLVVDPVMVATSGHRLLEGKAEVALKDHLFPLADLITPNLDEAAVLLHADRARSQADMLAQAHALQSMRAGAVLLKGGHLGGQHDAQAADDLLVAGDDIKWFSAPWVNTPHTHGTGCTLAAAITAGLALGQPLAEAIGAAKRYVTAALTAGRTLNVGRGHGPVDHLVDIARTRPDESE